MYDEANIDLEEMMYLQDIQDELDSEDKQLEADDSYNESYYLTPTFLDKQTMEKDSNKIIMKVLHKPSGKIFRGTVLGKCHGFKDKYVFTMYEVIDDEDIEPKKNKIFNLSDLVKRK